MEAIREMDPKSWMGQLSQDKQLRTLDCLALPSTHDSGAYQLNTCHPISSQETPNLFWSKLLALVPCVTSFVKKWTLTQSLSIYEQLQMGIRAFDFRLAWDGSDFWIVHTFSLVRLESALEQIKKFLLEQPSEVIVVRSKAGWEQRSTMTGRSGALESLLTSVVGNLTIPYSREIPTLEWCLVSGKRLLFSYEGSTLDIGSSIWTSDVFIGHWANTNNIDNLKADINALKRIPKPVGMFREVSFTLTPTTDDIKNDAIRTLTCRSTSSLRTFAKESNDLLLEMVNEDKSVFSTFSFLTMDYPTESCIKEIISLNL